MPIAFIKLIDEYVGRLIVQFIIAFKKIFSNNDKHSTAPIIKNILLIKFWGIGSIVLTTPALKKIKTVYPDSKIYYLTLLNNLEICREITLIDEVITIRLSNLFFFPFESIRKILLLRKINFDIVFDFEFYSYFSAILVSFIKSKFSVGFDNLKNNRDILFTKNISFNDMVHTKNNFLNLVNVILNNKHFNSNFINDTDFPEFITERKLNTNGKFRIIVNPNASKLAYERKLPENYFINIINYLINYFGCKVILIGTEEEKNYVDKIYQKVEQKKFVDNLCGKTTIKELILLIKSSSCIITVDSGPLHIASALNIPTIAFFGPESPQRYGPLSDKNLVFYKNLRCSPCMSISNSKTVNCIYDSPRCMEQFDIEDVNKKIYDFFTIY